VHGLLDAVAGRIELQDCFAGPQGGAPLCGKRVIGSEAGHELVTVNRFNGETGTGDRQRHNRRVNLSRSEFLYKLDGIAVRWPDRATWNNFLMQLADCLKQIWIDKRGAAEAQSTNLAAFDGNQRGNGFVAGIQNSLGNRLEGDAGFSELDAPILGFSE